MYGGREGERARECWVKKEERRKKGGIEGEELMISMWVFTLRSSESRTTPGWNVEG